MGGGESDGGPILDANYKVTLTCGQAGHIADTLEELIYNYGLQDQYERTLLDVTCPIVKDTAKLKQQEDPAAFHKNRLITQGVVLSKSYRKNVTHRLHAASQTLVAHHAEEKVFSSTELAPDDLREFQTIDINKPDILRGMRDHLNILTDAYFGLDDFRASWVYLQGMDTIGHSMKKHKQKYEAALLPQQQ